VGVYIGAEDVESDKGQLSITDIDCTWAMVIGLARHDVRGQMKSQSSASQLDSEVAVFNLSQGLRRGRHKSALSSLVGKCTIIQPLVCTRRRTKRDGAWTLVACKGPSPAVH
jgi:hypothetical protein